MNDIFKIILLIIILPLLMIDVFFPVIVSFYTDNFLFLFLYIVWGIPITLGWMLTVFITSMVLEDW